MKEILVKLNPNAVKEVPEGIKLLAQKWAPFSRYGELWRYFDNDDKLADRLQVLEQVLFNCCKDVLDLKKYVNNVADNLLDDYIVWDTHWRARG